MRGHAGGRIGGRLTCVLANERARGRGATRAVTAAFAAAPHDKTARRKEHEQRRGSTSGSGGDVHDCPCDRVAALGRGSGVSEAPQSGPDRELVQRHAAVRRPAVKCRNGRRRILACRAVLRPAVAAAAEPRWHSPRRRSLPALLSLRRSSHRGWLLPRPAQQPAALIAPRIGRQQSPSPQRGVPRCVR